VREAQTGKPQEYGFSLFSPAPKAGLVRFEWRHWAVRPMDLLGRVLWLLAGMGMVLLAAPLLDRFAARTSGREAQARAPGLALGWLGTVLQPLARTAFGALVATELTACLRERPRWWWLVWAGVLGLLLFGSPEVMRTGLLLGWLLPLDVLARGALRERDQRTGMMVFSSAGAVWRVPASRWLVAVSLLLLCTFAGLARLALQEPMQVLAALAVTAALASAGLAFAAVCRNARPFELVLVAAIYVATQGARLFNVQSAPLPTLLLHLTVTAISWVAIAVAWPRLINAVRDNS